MNTSILDSLLSRTSSRRRIGQEEDESKEKKEKKPFPPKKDEGGKGDESAIESDPPVEDAPSDGPGHKKPIDMEVTKTLDDSDVEDLPDPLKKGPGVIDEMLDSMPSHGPGHEGPSHHDHKGPKSDSPFGAPGDTPLDEEDIHMLTEGLQQVLQSGGLDTERQTRVTKLLDALEGAPGKMTLVHDGGGADMGKPPKSDPGADEGLPALDAPPPAGPKDKGKPEDGLLAASSLLDHLVARHAQRRAAQMDKPMGGPSRMMPGPDDERPIAPRPPAPALKPRNPGDQARDYYRNFDRHETTKAGSR